MESRADRRGACIVVSDPPEAGVPNCDKKRKPRDEKLRDEKRHRKNRGASSTSTECRSRRSVPRRSAQRRSQRRRSVTASPSRSRSRHRNVPSGRRGPVSQALGSMAMAMPQDMAQFSSVLNSLISNAANAAMAMQPQQPSQAASQPPQRPAIPLGELSDRLTEKMTEMCEHLSELVTVQGKCFQVARIAEKKLDSMRASIEAHASRHAARGINAMNKLSQMEAHLARIAANCDDGEATHVTPWQDGDTDGRDSFDRQGWSTGSWST